LRRKFLRENRGSLSSNPPGISSTAAELLRDPSAAERVHGQVAAWWGFALLWPCVAYVLPLAANPAGSGR